MREVSNARALHEKAREYWRNSVNARLASPEYYARQEAALREILAAIGPRASALDIGCGDGACTRIVREFCARVRGVDLSPHLIAQAIDAAPLPEGLVFEVGDIESLGDDRVDLALCMGVMSGLVDEAVFEDAVAALARIAAPGGAVVTKDTLAYGAPVTNVTDAYVARYRARDRYLAAFAEQGLVLWREAVLHDDPPRTRNSLFLFRRSDAIIRTERRPP